MEKIQSLEEGLAFFDSVFVKGLCVLAGAHIRVLFTEDEYVKFRKCVCVLCHPDSPPHWKGKLYHRYFMAMKETIKIVVVPSIENKHDDYLLVEVLHMWAKWRSMATFFSRLLAYHPDDDYMVPFADARLQFRDVVCSQFFNKCCDAVISLINNERRGTFTVGGTILKIFMAFSVEMGVEGATTYYDLFEQLLLADAEKYYSQMASELLQYDVKKCLKKVRELLSTEKKRGEGFLKKASLEKLMTVLTKTLADAITRKIIEKKNLKGTRYLKGLLEDA